MNLSLWFSVIYKSIGYNVSKKKIVLSEVTEIFLLFFAEIELKINVYKATSQWILVHNA